MVTVIGSKIGVFTVNCAPALPVEGIVGATGAAISG